MTTEHLESIGHLCASLQAPYARIQRAIASLELQPAVTLNGISYFSGDQCEQIADAVQQHPPTNAPQGSKR